MAQGLLLALNCPLWLGYFLSTLIIFPLVLYGLKVLSKVQTWTTPLWLCLMIIPLSVLIAQQPQLIQTFWNNSGQRVDASIEVTAVLEVAAVCLSLMSQIAEQIDYLRFMPPKTQANRISWWIAVISAGPGWVLFGMLKQTCGAFIAVYLVNQSAINGSDSQNSVSPTEPVLQFFALYQLFFSKGVATAIAFTLVVLSQVKINVTNAYSGSLALSGAFARVFQFSLPRWVFLVVHLSLSLLLMELDTFSFLNKILSFYSNFAISWISTVTSDVVLNRWMLKKSPSGFPEYRKGFIHNINIGVVVLLISAFFSVAIYFGLASNSIAPYSSLFALLLPFILSPLFGALSSWKFYRLRSHDGFDVPVLDALGNPSNIAFTCHVCHTEFERPDVHLCMHNEPVCSLCATLDRNSSHGFLQPVELSTLS